MSKETFRECSAALLETLDKLYSALELDIMLLKLEEQLGLMDGLPLYKEVG